MLNKVFLRFSNLIYTRKFTERRNPQKTTATKSFNTYKRDLLCSSGYSVVINTKLKLTISGNFLATAAAAKCPRKKKEGGNLLLCIKKQDQKDEKLVEFLDRGVSLKANCLLPIVA